MATSQCKNRPENQIPMETCDRLADAAAKYLASYLIPSSANEATKKTEWKSL